MSLFCWGGKPRIPDRLECEEELLAAPKFELTPFDRKPERFRTGVEMDSREFKGVSETNKMSEI